MNVSQRPGLVLNAHNGSNDQVFPGVLSLYVAPGSAVADVTFGRGVFWKRVPEDAFDLRATDAATGTDCRDLPYGDSEMDCVVFDPPYMHTPGGTAHAGHQSFERHYGNNRGYGGKRGKRHYGNNPGRGENGEGRKKTGAKYYEAVLELYIEAAREAWRVLRQGGIYIVKCQDQVCANAQRLAHVDIINGLSAQGFVPEDIFVVVRPSRPTVSRMVRQVHARKNHSYFLVFLKPQGRGRWKEPRRVFSPSLNP